MRHLTSLLVLAAAACAAPAAAHIEVDPRVFAEAELTAAPDAQAEEPAPTAEPVRTRRFVSPAHAAAERGAIGVFGPFRVLDAHTAALVGTTDSHSPAAFRAMLEAYPQIVRLNFVECPGTHDDRANLALGRLIRAAGLAAIVPAGGSVRSGAVELVVAGIEVEIEDGAEFAVHAWEDQDGRDPADYGPDAIENRKYLAYYREMGMSEESAAAFYAMTNSAPFEDPLWLEGEEMRRWM